ncbi:MAG: AAA family ATPase, partial [Chloroflexota bacterium]
MPITASAFQAIARYVPALVIRRYSQHPESLNAADMETVPCAVLFADIAGFTVLTERLAEHAGGGAEELTHLLNRYFGQLIDIVHGHGGEIVKFAGDAVLALWPADVEPLQTAVRRAAQCALAIQQVLGDGEAAPELRLSMRIALNAGDIQAMYVGGVYGRWELLVAGEPLLRLGDVGHQAQPGDVVLTAGAWSLLGDASQGETSPQRAVRIHAVTAPRPKPRELPAPPTEAEGILWSYIPNAVRARISAGQTDWLSELRPVSIIFLNLPDLDPSREGGLERTQTIMRALQTAVYRYEGSINKVSVDDKGASLVVVYGLPPLSHEDDPARAVAAALDMQAALGALGVRPSIGITSGRAFCGTVGSELRCEYTVMGDVVNTAARLMQAATDSVLCDGETRRAAQARFAFDELPPFAVKGKAELVRAWRPTSRIESGQDITRLIGRQAEQERLSTSVEQLLNGESGLLLIEGEAGIGKSRLVTELLTQAKARGVTSLVRTGDATQRSTPYYAWRPIFAQLFDVEVLVEPAEIRAHVMEQLAGDPELERLAPLLNAVLPWDLPDSEITAQMQGGVRARQTQDLLVRLLQEVAEAGAASGRPLVLVLEDAHWLDSASWALISQVHAEVKPLLLALAARPLAEPYPPEYVLLLRAPNLSRLRVKGMSGTELRDLVCERLGARDLPAEVTDLIQERAGGNPFFGQELAYALRDSGMITIKSGRCTVPKGAAAFRDVGFPDTIQGVITSRIDRLTPPQQMAIKVASVFGPMFPVPGLTDVYPIDADRSALPECLERLERLDFTEPEATEPHQIYRFKHGLTQEVAYNLMLLAQRRELHRAIARWYEREEGAEGAHQYELLARHWSRAGLATKAVRYFEQAGDSAFVAGIYREGLHFFGEALRLASEPDMEGNVAAAPLRARLKRKLAAVRWDAGQREGAFDDLRAGLELLEGQAEHLELAHLYQQMGRMQFRSGENGRAIEWAEKALGLAERLAGNRGDGVDRGEIAAAISQSHNTIGAALARLGDFPQA